ncbi:MAG: TetR/AcrR family transcriptional regulator [Bifidobacterium aquikefiri]|uniref:TetR family transcriptional regulator n=1 Tax=Bifidobacterium aquikefiri TaxID=1653207 RepID=A0A261G0Z9_9BIFI|nr:TetR/AcrR family transcriptional regulator [Bifidobacterium aquikefiri]OZG65101.1 TetR family transcriptional regulator [Bifidobacterium aquikefiri]
MTSTRRRGQALEAAILDAGWNQLIKGGYTSFTFEAIAERAETGKSVIYRRWPDKEKLLLAVIKRQGFGAPSDIPDMGSLREDLLALLRTANQRSERAAILLSTILSAYFSGEISLTPERLRTALLGDQSRALTEILRHAVDRGELPTGDIPPRIVRLPTDLLRQEIIMNLNRVPDETIVDIVDTIFLPLVTDTRLQSTDREETQLNLSGSFHSRTASKE